MPIPDNLIEQARNADLLLYLHSQDYELRRSGPNEYCLAEHDSLKISNNLWHWFSHGIGGNTLDFLTKYEGKSFRDAVFELTGKKALSLPKSGRPATKFKPVIAFVPPLPSLENTLVFAYLQSRGIDKYVIHHCMTTGVLYEDSQYHNAVFVGKDKEGVPRYAAVRSTQGDFKGDVDGSDKRYGFSLTPEQTSKALYVFESPIDALSFITLESSSDQFRSHYLALGGVSPLALNQYLSDHAGISTVCICLDNDPPGREATGNMKKQLWDKGYTVHDLPPDRCKDYNEYLTTPFNELFKGREQNSRPSHYQQAR